MSRETKPRVFVIILNWNGWKDTIECLESLQQLDYPNFRMIVVDNGSSDDSWDRIRAWTDGREVVQSPHISYRQDTKPVAVTLYDKVEAEAGGTTAGEAVLSGTSSERVVTLIQSGANRGFAGGCNIGVRYALKHGAEYLWLLNNDTVVDPRSLAEMVKLARSNERVGIVGSVLRYYHNPEAIQTYGGGSINWWLAATSQFTGPEQGRLDHIVGTSLLVKGQVVEEVGYLDERYFFYLEETDYCQQAVKMGWNLAVADDSHILHRVGGSVSKDEGSKSLRSDAYDMRSTILFFSKHGGMRWPLAVLLRLGGVVINRWRRGQADRILPLLKVAVDACWEVAASGKMRWPFRRTANRVSEMDKSD